MSEPKMPEEASREWEEEISRREKVFAAFMKRWPNFAKHAAYAALGDAIAVCDCLGLDVEGFLKNLRKSCPRPDFVLKPDPKARS